MKQFIKNNWFKIIIIIVVLIIGIIIGFVLNYESSSSPNYKSIQIEMPTITHNINGKNHLSCEAVMDANVNNGGVFSEHDKIIGETFTKKPEGTGSQYIITIEGNKLNLFPAGDDRSWEYQIYLNNDEVLTAARVGYSTYNPTMGDFLFNKITGIAVFMEGSIPGGLTPEDRIPFGGTSYLLCQ